MVLRHNVEPKINLEEPMTTDVLIIVLPVLPNDSSVWMSCDFFDKLDNLEFFIETEISDGVFGSEERDRYCILLGPGNTEAGNCFPFSFNIHCKPAFSFGKFCQEPLQSLLRLLERRTDCKSLHSWRVIPTVRFSRNLAEIMNCEESPVPFTKNGRRVDSWDDFSPIP